MFASIRRYRLTRGSMEELTRRVDDGFADEICTQPGFVSYEFMDRGEGEIMTISLFGEAQHAEASRALAQRWTEENLTDLEFTRIEALRGEVMVSRATHEMLEPAHVTANRKFASVRRYRLHSGSVGQLMHCGSGEILSVSLFRDQSSAEDSDERALEFVSERLGGFEIERTLVIGGEVRVSRALAELLQPAHA
jgi:hypothetical protein